MLQWFDAPVRNSAISKDFYSSSQSPKSTTTFGTQNQAILTHARLWTLSPLFGGDDDTHTENELPIEPWMLTPTSQCKPVVTLVCPYLKVTSCSGHRVAGWKDGNSLYVALNAHYLTT